MTTGKTLALIIQTFISKVMSLLFNTLSGFVTAFLLRSKHHLISWLIEWDRMSQNHDSSQLFHCSAVSGCTLEAWPAQQLTLQVGSQGDLRG